MTLTKPKKIPVLLTFDLDGEVSTRLAAEVKEPGIDDPEMGSFGPREGYLHILKLLARYETKATFQIVGKIAELYPETIRALHRHGHELAIHSYTHRDYQTLSYEELDEELGSTKALIQELTGVTALGHRSPYWRQSPHLPELLHKHGLRWNSDAHIKYEETQFLKPYYFSENILELPSSECLDDWTTLLTRKMTVPAVLQSWQAKLAACYEQQVPFVLVMHPFIIGQLQFLPLLEAMLETIKTQEDQFLLSCPYELLGEPY
jgi:peptidoglycan/xylan/chitin deacetylase (PgdA/CDA1 family)